MAKLALLATGLGVLLGTAPLLAHHSVQGTYLEDAPLAKIEGTVKEFLLRNPHSYIRVEDNSGSPVLWNIEWGPGGRLAALGVRRDSLKAGDHVIVTGNPGRNPSDHRLYLRTIDRPSDGFHVEQAFTETFLPPPR